MDVTPNINNILQTGIIRKGLDFLRTKFPFPLYVFNTKSECIEKHVPLNVSPHGMVYLALQWFSFLRILLIENTELK